MIPESETDREPESIKPSETDKLLENIESAILKSDPKYAHEFTVNELPVIEVLMIEVAEIASQTVTPVTERELPK